MAPGQPSWSLLCNGGYISGDAWAAESNPTHMLSQRQEINRIRTIVSGADASIQCRCSSGVRCAVRIQRCKYVHRQSQVLLVTQNESIDQICGIISLEALRVHC